jgi:hypothetical protein
VERNRRASTICVSNREPSEWLGMTTDALLAQSAVERLTSGAHTLVVEGPSYRQGERVSVDTHQEAHDAQKHLQVVPYSWQRTGPSTLASDRQGEIDSLTLGLEGTHPPFPWKPSTTMLTYRLTGTTQGSGSTTTNTTSVLPGPHPNATATGTNLRAPRCASKTAPRC